jgi:hypothetical protein
MSKLVSGHNYDILDNHQDKFKQPDALFQPRIKNGTKESSLQKSSHYQPPRRRKKATNNNNTSQGQTSARESVISTTERLKHDDDEYQVNEEIPNDDDEDDDDDNRVKARMKTHLNTSRQSNAGLNESNNFLNTSHQSQQQQKMEARRVAAQK